MKYSMAILVAVGVITCSQIVVADVVVLGDGHVLRGDVVVHEDSGDITVTYDAGTFRVQKKLIYKIYPDPDPSMGHDELVADFARRALATPLDNSKSMKDLYVFARAYSLEKEFETMAVEALRSGNNPTLSFLLGYSMVDGAWVDRKSFLSERLSDEFLVENGSRQDISGMLFQYRFPALMRLAESNPTDSQKSFIALNLGKIYPPEKAGLSVLVRFLEAAEATSVRYDAVTALQEIGGGGPAAVDALVRIVEDESAEVQKSSLPEEAAKAVAMIGPAAASAVPVFLDELLHETHIDTFKSAKVLLAIGEASIDPLAEKLQQAMTDTIKANDAIRDFERTNSEKKPDEQADLEVLHETAKMYAEHFVRSARVLRQFGAQATRVVPILEKASEVPQLKDSAERALAKIRQ